MEVWLAIIAVMGTLLGTFGGAYLNYYFGTKQRSQEVLFAVRREVYVKLTGISRNMILNNVFSHNELKDFQRIASECSLLASESSRKEIVYFINLLDKSKSQDPFSLSYSIQNKKALIEELKKLEVVLKADLEI